MPKALRWHNFVLSIGLTSVFVVWAMVSGTQRSWLTAPTLLGIAAFWVTIIATRVVSTG